MFVFLSLLCAILVVLLAISVYYNYKFGKLIISFEDAVEESLDELDKSYERISKILEIPVFFDSVEVRQVIEEIEISRAVILKVANNLTKTTGREDDTQEEDR
jgi:hypothetical protein